MRRSRLLMFLALAVAVPAMADPMRCGKWVVDEAASVDELLKKCGEPQDKSSVTEDVFATNSAGYRYRIGEQTTEKWRYQSGRGALPMLVVIVEGRIKSIQRTE